MALMDPPRDFFALYPSSLVTSPLSVIISALSNFNC
jgi:hypothetical protein